MVRILRSLTCLTLITLFAGQFPASAVPKSKPKPKSRATSLCANQPIEFIRQWKVCVIQVTFPGQTLKTEYEEFTAKGTWAVVKLSIANKTQSTLNLEGFYENASKLIDTRPGRTYVVDYSASLSYADFDTTKPFTPNETRTITLLYDVPRNASLGQLEVDAFPSPIVLSLTR
ncbi:MAG: hypothetical protein B0A82_16225 [Alkalinema sp. CACIAM 70d]|nr:MAG: hypothetical protein B0A82_16225 [Alkalinema sp. CACIAM 70d]